VPYLTTSQKLQGDPFIHKRILGGIGGFVTGGVGGAIGGFTKGGKKSTPSPPRGGIPPFRLPGGSVPPRVVIEPRSAAPGGRPFVSLAGTATGGKRRRMDPLNVKALRRATRRLTGFQREAKKVDAALRKIAPKSRSRTPRHHHHVSSHN